MPRALLAKKVMPFGSCSNTASSTSGWNGRAASAPSRSGSRHIRARPRPRRGARPVADHDAGVEIAEAAGGQHLGGRVRSSRLGYGCGSWAQSRIRSGGRAAGSGRMPRPGPSGGAMRPSADRRIRGEPRRDIARQVADIETSRGLGRRTEVQRGGGGDVAAPGVLDAHPGAEMQAEVARPAQRRQPAEFRELQRDGVHDAEPCASSRRRCHGPVRRASSAGRWRRAPGAVGQRRAGLFQHHVEIRDGAADPDGVERGRAAVPVAIDQRAGPTASRTCAAGRRRPASRIRAELHLELRDARGACASRAMRAISSGATQVIE
jgi:hypothetical protein